MTVVMEVMEVIVISMSDNDTMIVNSSLPSSCRCPCYSMCSSLIGLLLSHRFPSYTQPYLVKRQFSALDFIEYGLGNLLEGSLHFIVVLSIDFYESESVFHGHLFALFIGDYSFLL